MTMMGWAIHKTGPARPMSSTAPNMSKAEFHSLASCTQSAIEKKRKSSSSFWERGRDGRGGGEEEGGGVAGMANGVVDYAEEAQGHRGRGGLLHHGAEGPSLQVPGGVQEVQGPRRPLLPPRQAHQDLRLLLRQELRRRIPSPQVPFSSFSLFSFILLLQLNWSFALAFIGKCCFGFPFLGLFMSLCYVIEFLMWFGWLISKWVGSWWSLLYHLLCCSYVMWLQNSIAAPVGSGGLVMDYLGCSLVGLFTVVLEKDLFCGWRD